MPPLVKICSEHATEAIISIAFFPTPCPHFQEKIVKVWICDDFHCFEQETLRD